MDARYQRLLPLTSLDGTTHAMGARQIMEFILLQETDRVLLKPATELAIAAVEAEKGETLTKTAISNLKKPLTKFSRVLTTEATNKGRVRIWWFVKGPDFDLFESFLRDNPGWGTESISQDQSREMDERIAIHNFMSVHHAVRVTRDQPLPRPSWAWLMQRYQAGELDMLFFESDRVAYTQAEGEKARRAREVDIASVVAEFEANA